MLLLWCRLHISCFNHNLLFWFETSDSVTPYRVSLMLEESSQWLGLYYFYETRLHGYGADSQKDSIQGESGIRTHGHWVLTRPRDMDTYTAHYPTPVVNILHPRVLQPLLFKIKNTLHELQWRQQFALRWPCYSQLRLEFTVESALRVESVLKHILDFTYMYVLS